MGHLTLRLQSCKCRRIDIVYQPTPRTNQGEIHSVSSILIELRLKHLIHRVTEVRSKILTPLETTGGISFSLEGFEKMLFTIQNFTQGDLHSTGGIQMSFQGVYNSTGGI